MIDALDPADYTEEGVFDEDAYNLDRDGLAALRDAEGTRTEEEIAAELEPIEERLDGEYALKSLTGGRELSEEAMGVFEARVDEYLESDEYLASKEIDEEPLLLTEEEVPVE